MIIYKGRDISFLSSAHQLSLGSHTTILDHYKYLEARLLLGALIFKLHKPCELTIEEGEKTSLNLVLVLLHVYQLI